MTYLLETYHIEDTDPLLQYFDQSIDTSSIPDHFTLMLDHTPSALAKIAAEQLQHYLNTQQEWQHNFGLSNHGKGAVIGKMFGVLVVKTNKNQIGYLAAFSGKLAEHNHHTGFVPPVFDLLATDGFLNQGMEELTAIIQEIKKIEELQPDGFAAQISALKIKRKNHSITLQKKIFDQYHFLNTNGEEKSLNQIFADAVYKNPPAGAGECAAPKLLQYAFLNKMQPLAIAEFWWGQSPKSDFWKHKHYYPCCQEKCVPILGHMLSGMRFEYK